MTLAAALLAAAVTWHPSADWQDTPDPVASPLAKKGGILRFCGANPPKSLNAYVDNNSYTIMMFSLMYSQLIATDSETLEFVPCLARRWGTSDDGSEFLFEIDGRATWSDGEPVSALDVKWTFDAVVDKANDTGPWKVTLGEFESPDILDADSPRPMKLRFRKKRRQDGSLSRDWRDLMNCGTFWILPKHAFEGKDFDKLDLVGAPVGGPYRISRAEEQVETEYVRVDTWWRRDLPSCRGVCNFDRILMRYYIDQENGFAALKQRKIDVYPVYTARIMAMETDSRRFSHNWILKRRVTNHNPVGYQGFAMNIRRPPFDDIRVRKAMAKLIDREFMNSTMMYSEYFLQKSFYGAFYDSDHPNTNELYLLDFDGAKKLLEEAGFAKNPETGRLERDGKPFEFTFLSRGKTEDRFLAIFNEKLSQLGIGMNIVRKDFASWMRDMDAFNFDMTWQSWGAALFPYPETSWSSAEADRRQSNNTVGFKSAEVDGIIAAEKTMETVAERAEAYRRIDALVAAECPYAFLWNIDQTRLLYWNKFGMPDTVLSRIGNEADVLTYWWYDPDRVEELERAVESGGYLPSVPVKVDYDAVMKARRARAEGASEK